MTLQSQLEQYFPQLRERISARGTNAAAVAKSAKMPHTQLSRLLNHPRDVRVSTIIRLERALDEASNVPRA